MGFLSSFWSKYSAEAKSKSFTRVGKPKMLCKSLAFVDSVSSDSNTASSYYSGSTGRWKKHRIYITAGGNLIIHTTKYSQWQGERDIDDAVMCKSIADVNAHFGSGGWLERYLIETIENTFEIETGEIVE